MLKLHVTLSHIVPDYKTMGNSDSVPLKPEEVQSLRQTFTADKLESMLEQASGLYGEESEERNHEKVIEEVEAIKVKHEQEIFLLNTEMKKKDELLREAERTLNEVRWELEEVTEQNRQNEAELKRIKEESSAKDSEGTSQSDQSQRIEENSKKTKENLRLKKERAELLTKFNKLDILMKEHDQSKEEEIKKVKDQCDFKLFQKELKFTFLQRRFDELTETHAKAQASLDLVELRTNMDEINKDLLRKEVEELTDYKNNSLKVEKLLKQQVEDLKVENSRLKVENSSIKEKRSESPFRFRDVKSGN